MSDPNRPGPTAAAVALAYRTGDPAPKVVAKGKGLIAEQIIKKAGQSGVFVHESKELVSLLMQVDLDKTIPPLLYRVVAELLAWLYHVESAQKDGRSLPEPPEIIIPTIDQRDTAATDSTNDQ
ncbi:EscU/YscU/HrcU family type III secretion system export apparatus switch protein [Pseudoduganella sp. GCM10020061]|uniref:EscU/YscU/HrcU family type III secretion system export apparatus switch protein n=1 Tax=Pseudoduganella sp. GCM10020061 TaxID=3317345 RepID=UPI00362C241E